MAVSAHAQGAGGAPAATQVPDNSAFEVTTTREAGNFYSLSVPGGNVGVLVGPDGILMVDTQYPQVTDYMIAAVRKISSLPIRYLINTHYHGDHAGGDSKLAKMGTVIFARDEVRAALMRPGVAADGSPTPPAPPAGLPIVTYREALTFHMDDEEVSVFPLPRGHSAGDSLVIFHSADVMMTGDVFRTVAFPLIDAADGGSLDGLVDGVGLAIGLSGPNTKIVSGHGPTSDRAGMILWKDMITMVRDRVSEMIREGKTQDEVVALHLTADFEAKTSRPAGSGDRFVGQVYARLKAAK
ncbi:MAG: MBL fold metallo-hydrolase [Candidatus Acidiferrales bacterium]|jgi:glyoxylase-like metal-dependent hydrolase (beta-lactamase superfamily II)